MCSYRYIFYFLVFTAVTAAVTYVFSVSESTEHLEEVLEYDVSKNIVSILSNTTQKEHEILPEEVFTLTNAKREIFGLPPLRWNEKLAFAAKRKVDDMFTYQYFEHISPRGVAPQDIITSVGYEYLLTAENIARGAYNDALEIVDGWMASKPHREAILNPFYTEVGIAVKKGKYQHKEIWLAAQEFGTPRDVCPDVPFTLKDKIERNKRETSLLKRELDLLLHDLEKLDEYTEEYRNVVSKYNSKLRSYNLLVRNTSQMVDEYNMGVRLFNDCLLRFGADGSK